MAAALKKWKREREEHGYGTSNPSPKRERELSPLPPAAEKDQVTHEPVSCQETCDKYLKEVQATFKDDAESSRKFLELIQDVHLKQVDYAGVVSRIQKLFRGHTSLILGFNTFLPEHHQITLPSTEVTEPPEVLMKQRQGIMFVRKVEALGKSKYKKFREILALYKKGSNSIDDVYKLAATLFAGHKDLLADFRTFLPTLEGSDSEMPAQEPHQQPALGRREVTFVHDLSANVRDNEAPGKSSRRAEMARKGKEKMETTNSKEVAGKLKERTSNREEEARTKPTQAPEPARMSAHNATRREQVQTAPTNAPPPASDQRVSARTAARKQSLANEDTNTPPFVHDLSANVRDNEAPGKSSRRAEMARKGKEKMETTNSKEVTGKLKERTSNREEEARTKPTQAPEPARMSAHNATRREQVQTPPTNAPPPASDQRVSARTAARKQSLLANGDTNTPPTPSPHLPSSAELQERLKTLTKCRPDCKACEHVEYPIFDWQAEDPEYYAKGKANRERERQKLIASGGASMTRSQ